MPKRPNVVIFNPDQYRGDVLGHAGNPAAVTPTLDRLAREDDNRIGDPSLAGVLAALKDRLLTFYLETGDAVPHETDLREPPRQRD